MSGLQKTESFLLAYEIASKPDCHEEVRKDLLEIARNLAKREGLLKSNHED